ncbi:MAG: SPASM domain-containing protein [Cyclobacteriaceae bacterium]|nr:SPASM domain-containing protein [Cyclobacteriaceae bacterium]MDW8330312.1 SPASM domain-containing protein [Cyclobacteriaceae bacterium]
MRNGLMDIRNGLQKLTMKRLHNFAQVLGSYYRSRITGKPDIKGLPVALAFEPTTSCNLRCPECPSGLRSFTRPTGMLNTELFKSVINQVADRLMYLTFYFQGEPYLHPEFLPMVQHAAGFGIYTATSTNAHFLNDERARLTVESGLDRLIISIDGTTQQTYQSYRIGGNLNKVLEGTANIVKWKKTLKRNTPHIIFQFLVVRHNEHEIPEVYRLARQLGVNEVKLKTAQIYNYQHGSDLIPVNEKYSRYRRMPDGSYRIKNSLDNHCWRMWHSCVITWDGKVVPCCFDKDAHHVLGDVSRQSFEEIWHSDMYRDFRAKLLISRKQTEMCANCTEGTRVWA